MVEVAYPDWHVEEEVAARPPELKVDLALDLAATVALLPFPHFQIHLHKPSHFCIIHHLDPNSSQNR